MNVRSKVATSAGIAALLLPAVQAAAGAAPAPTGPIVTATGTCTQGSRWELAAAARPLRIGSQFRIDSSRAGQHWLLVGAHSGRLFGIGVRRTNVVGDLTVIRWARNLDGVDVVRVWARNQATKEVCRARLTL